MIITAIIDYAIFPLFIVSSMVAAWALQLFEVPNLWITPLVVAPFVVIVWFLEQFRPEREFLERDFSLFLEGMHFIFNFEFGYGIALLAIGMLEYYLRMVLPVNWPLNWPVALQLLWAVTLYEASSYWQHRFFHRYDRLWAFHALHHSGARLDLIRSARFHFFDFATVAFLAFLPLAILGTPENIVTLLAILVSILGLLHHGNIRLRTPAWLNWVVCTPAVHRRHHSKISQESNANFGNTVMFFDLLFGSYGKPHPVGPKEIGIENDPTPEGFWAQIWGPFQKRKNI